MSVCQADTCQCPLHLSKSASCCVVIEGATITSFFISCIKRLWDSVGHFLGCRESAPKALEAGPFGSLRVLMGVSIRPVSEMPS